MHRRTLLAVVLAAMLALAGCAGSTTSGAPTAGGENGGSAGDGGTAATGTVQFYVSDQPAAIEDFEHLNVTITQIGFERANDADGDGTEAETATATPAPNATATATNLTPTPTAGDGGTPTAEDAEAEEADGSEDETEADEQGSSEDEKRENEDRERAGWETVEVDSRTVDLTRLRGDNATLVGAPEIPAGEYTKVFVYVDSINATLTTGESVTVKLPSQKLQLNKGFTLEPNGTVQFVYDINVVKAGNSGKYILKPVISQSGPDQPVKEVDGEGDGADDAGPDDADEREEKAADRADDAETEGDEAETPEPTDTDDGGQGPPDDRGNN
ncbi:MAG: DUF4382 domain-containing protein [Haloarculaceae archaeon]